MKKNYSLALIALTLASCGNKQDPNGAAPIVLKNNEVPVTEDVPEDEVLDGEYECYAGPDNNWYLYHKLVLKRSGNAVSGTLFSGEYMSKSEQGYYTMPAGTITSVVTGSIAGKNQLMLYLGTVQDSSLMEDEGKMPDQKKMFKRDDQGDAAAVLYKSGQNFLWLINRDTLVFEKAPAIGVE